MSCACLELDSINRTSRASPPVHVQIHVCYQRTCIASRHASVTKQSFHVERRAVRKARKPLHSSTTLFFWPHAPRAHAIPCLCLSTKLCAVARPSLAHRTRGHACAQLHRSTHADEALRLAIHRHQQRLTEQARCVSSSWQPTSRQRWGHTRHAEKCGRARH